MSDVAEPPSKPQRVRKWDRPPAPHDWRFWVGGLGKALIATGLLMFGFVAYQLWGTGIEAARAQNALENEFEELLATTSTTDAEVVTTVPDATVPAGSTPAGTVPVDSFPADTAPAATAPSEPPAAPELPPIEEGDPIARIEMPTIGVDSIVVAGVQTSDLKKGPGHYPGTPLPGQLGNTAIAGHRTTYGQPFFDVDKLHVGDQIVVTTLTGRFVYSVTGQRIVSAQDYAVVATTDPTRATITLTSCHPKWTARDRIIITGELDAAESTAAATEPTINYGRPLDETALVEVTTADPGNIPTTDPDAAIVDDPVVNAPTETADVVHQDTADAFSDGWFSDPGANGQVALWGLLLAAIGVCSYLISKKAKRDWVGLLVGIVPFLVTLYFFFQNVNRLLPPNL